MKVNIGILFGFGELVSKIKQFIVRRIVEVCHVEKDISHIHVVKKGNKLT